MTTIAEAQAELVDALDDADIRVTDDLGGLDPPAAIVYFDGFVTGMILAGVVEARFRVTLVAGGWDGGGVAGTLAALVQSATSALYNLGGWSVGDGGPDSVVSLAGSRLLGADLTASRMVNI